MRRTIWALGAAAALALAPQAKAADYEVQNVFEDAVYGAGIGALVGFGLALIGNRTAAQTLDYALTGAGVGIIAGVAYGLYAGSRAVAEIEDGEIRWNAPAPQLARGAGGEVAVRTELLRARF